MKNRCILRKYAAIAALAVSAIVFLPEALFAKGAVVGYAWVRDNPTDAQLEKLTHLVALELFPYPAPVNGSLLNTSSLPAGWNGTKNTALLDLVDRAHAMGVKVIIEIGGESSENFVSATNSTYINTFVSQIVTFVNDHGLDGVDINWECPGIILPDWELKDPAIQVVEWNQCIALLTDLKTALPCKRISMPLPSIRPTNNSKNYKFYPNQTIPAQIWNAVDALHLMTYDDHYWPTHSHADSAKVFINKWATWGASNGLGDPASREKLFIGCAFYGYNRDASGNTIWELPYPQEPRVFYKNGGSTCGNPSDTPSDVISKVNHCYSNVLNTAIAMF